MYREHMGAFKKVKPDKCIGLGSLRSRLALSATLGGSDIPKKVDIVIM